MIDVGLQLLFLFLKHFVPLSLDARAFFALFLLENRP
jgi:hypothetical protein